MLWDSTGYAQHSQPRCLVATSCMRSSYEAPQLIVCKPFLTRSSFSFLCIICHPFLHPTSSRCRLCIQLLLSHVGHFQSGVLRGDVSALIEAWTLDQLVEPFLEMRKVLNLNTGPFFVVLCQPANSSRNCNSVRIRSG